MKGQIRYNSQGVRTYYLDGKEVTESVYQTVCGDNDRAKLKEMLSESAVPHCISDCTFMRDTANGRQFAGQEHIGDFYRAACEAHGGQHLGRKYISQLAKFPGDPEAWVDSRDDVKRALEKRPGGWQCEGTVNYTSPALENPPPPGPAIAEDIVEGYATEIAMKDPHPERVDMVDLKDQVRERIAPKRKKAK